MSLFDRLGQGISNAVNDPNFNDRLILGLSGLTMNPNQAAIQYAQGNIKQRREKDSLNRQSNATIEFLRQSGVKPEILAQAKENPALLQALANEVMKSKFSNGPSKGLDKVTGIRKEYAGAVQPFIKQAEAFSRMNSIYSQGSSPANDIALIFQYMKMLDPGSTVREGEFATAQNAGGIGTKVSNIYNSLVEGKRLTSEQRQDFFGIAKGIYGNALDQYEKTRGQYGEYVSDYGFDPEKYLPDYSYSGQIGMPKSFNVPEMLDPTSGKNVGENSDKMDLINKLGITIGKPL